MRLSFAMITRNSAGWVEPLLWQMQKLANELVVWIDEETRDRTAKLCLEYGARVKNCRVTQGTIEPLLTELYESCSGDWVLRLDDDELMEDMTRKDLDAMMRNDPITHYWLPRRYLWGDSQHYLLGPPWYPDYQMRLARRELVSNPGRLHCHDECGGPGAYTAYHILHRAYLLHSAEERLAKLHRYLEHWPESNQPCYTQLIIPEEYEKELSVGVRELRGGELGS